MSGSGEQRAGVAYAAAAFLMWGLFPLYWKPLAAVPALEVVAHRTVWGLVSVAIWVTWRRRWGEVRTAVAHPRTLLLLTASAGLIAVNWLTYIWAVINGHVVESSLGYYINPLVTVVLGVIVLKERLTRAQVIAVGLATLGVAILTVGHGRFPWIALALAGTFALYSLVRKTVAADAVIGLLIETAILAPAALGYLAVAAVRGTGALGRSGAFVDALLVLAGAVTAVPLVLFTLGARRLPLSTIGLIQYISPSCQFLLAVLAFREPFTSTHAGTFALIWTALALLTWDLRRQFADTPPVPPDD